MSGWLLFLNMVDERSWIAVQPAGPYSDRPRPAALLALDGDALFDYCRYMLDWHGNEDGADRISAGCIKRRLPSNTGAR